MKKIMFNDKYELTQAVLNGRKTQTRRLASPFLPDAVRIGYARFEIANGRELRCWTEGASFIKFNLPYRIGEIIAVAQSYKELGYLPLALNRSPKDWRVVNRERPTLYLSKGWNNKMFVRAEACKHHIRTINVRIERLQDISDSDCFKEGIIDNGWYFSFKRYTTLKAGEAIITHNYTSPREAFATLIDKVSGKGTWERNPYVFVYDFELVKP